MKDLKGQFIGALLFILTVAAVSCAVINFHQQSLFRLPDDGVTWVDRDNAIQALFVASGSQGEHAGIRAGDQLLKINGVTLHKSLQAAEVLSHTRKQWFG